MNLLKSLALIYFILLLNINGYCKNSTVLNGTWQLIKFNCIHNSGDTINNTWRVDSPIAFCSFNESMMTFDIRSDSKESTQSFQYVIKNHIIYKKPIPDFINGKSVERELIKIFDFTIQSDTLMLMNCPQNLSHNICSSKNQAYYIKFNGQIPLLTVEKEMIQERELEFIDASLLKYEECLKISDSLGIESNSWTDSCKERIKYLKNKLHDD